MSKGQKSTAQILGVEAKVVTWNTSDEDGPVTATLTTFQIDGVYFLLSQIITKEVDRGSADKLKKAVASLALVGGGKAVATAPKEAAPAKPAATPAPAKPAATEAPAVASAKPSAPAQSPAASKPAAVGETVMFPKGNPMLSFKKPADWVITVPPSGKPVMTLQKPDGPVVTFSAGADLTKTASEAEVKALAEQTARGMTEGPLKGFKTGPVQEAAFGPFKGFAIDLTGENQGQPLLMRISFLRNAKGRFVSVIVPAPPGPLHPETRALLDSIAAAP